LLDFFTFAICPPYSETTDGEKFDMVLELVAGECDRRLSCDYRIYNDT